MTKQHLLGIAFVTVLSSICAAAQPSAAPDDAKSWVARSNQYTHQLLDIQLKYSPEDGSGQGLAKFDKLISDPTRAAELAERKETERPLPVWIATPPKKPAPRCARTSPF